jgi:alpha-1,6-mannosyltransferase
MSRTTLYLSVLGTALLLITVAALALHIPRADSGLRPGLREMIVGVMVLAGFVYLMAVFTVLRHNTSRPAVWIVIGVAVVMRLAFVFDHPVMSSDIYRYVWDGKVQNAGINPYRYIPNDPALQKLRDTRVYPFINRVDYAHTIYPPAAQVIFAAVGVISKSVLAMKIAIFAFEFLGCFCMLKLLAMANLPPERILIYAWNPLVQWSFAFDGHVDAIAIGLLGLALLYRARHKTGLAGAFLAAATLVKFFPLVVAPAFVRGERLWRPLVSGAAVVVVLYALYSSVGTQVFGFMSGYNQEEGLTNGSGIWLLSGIDALNNNTDLVDLPDDYGKYYLFGAAAVIGLLGVWLARRALKPGETDVVVLCRDTAILATCSIVAISPHYPWYFAWLALPAVVAPLPGVIWLSVAPVILYLTPGRDFVLWGSFIYVPAFAMTALSVWNSRAINSAQSIVH